MNPVISPEAREAAHLEVSTVLVRTFDGQGNPSDGVHIGHYVQSLLDSKQAEIDEANGRLIKLANLQKTVDEAIATKDAMQKTLLDVSKINAAQSLAIRQKDDVLKKMKCSCDRNNDTVNGHWPSCDYLKAHEALSITNPDTEFQKWVGLVKFIAGNHFTFSTPDTDLMKYQATILLQSIGETP